MIPNLLERWVGWVLDHRRLVVSFVGLFTIAALCVFPRGIIGTSLEAVFFGPEHSEFARYKDQVSTYGSDESIVIGIDLENPYESETLERLKHAHEAVAAIDAVGRVASPYSVERVGLVADTIAVRNLADEAAKPGADPVELLEELQSDPAAGGLLVSKEDSGFLLVALLEDDASRRAEDVPGIVDEIIDSFASAGFTRDEIYVNGLSAVHAEIIRSSRSNLERLFPFVALMLLIAVFLMFGRLWPVFTNTVAALLAVIWAMALSILLDPYVNILVTLVPALVMIISFSDVVHLCSAYLLELEDGKEKREAIITASVDVGEACLLTSATTAVGFISITFIPTPIFQHLGWVSAFGVFAAYGLAISLVPILLWWIETPHNWREGKNSWLQDRIDDVLEGCATLSLRHPQAIVLAFAVFTAGLGYSISQIEFETQFMQRLSEENRVRQDERFFEERFASTSVVEVFVETGEEGGVLDPDFFSGLLKFEAEVEALDAVDIAVGLPDYMRATHLSIVGSNEGFGALTGEALAQMMVLLEMPGIDALSHVVNFERSGLRMTVYVDEPGIRGRDALATRIESIANTHFDAEVFASGMEALMGSWVTDIIEGQRRGLVFSLVIIALILMIAFRSIRTGAVAMWPNLLPLMALGGAVGLMWDKVDTDSMLLAMIAIGIGVDDTIHFLSRLRIECRRTHDLQEAITNTFHFSGRGIFMTTFIFTVGFLPFAASDYLTIELMGLLLPLCFVVALLADLLLVPALARLGFIVFRVGEDQA